MAFPIGAFFSYIISIIRLHVIDLYNIHCFFPKFFLKLTPCIHTFCGINPKFRLAPTRSQDHVRKVRKMLSISLSTSIKRRPRSKSCSSFTARNNYSKLFTKEGERERSGGHDWAYADIIGRELGTNYFTLLSEFEFFFGFQCQRKSQRQ